MWHLYFEYDLCVSITLRRLCVPRAFTIGGSRRLDAFLKLAGHDRAEQAAVSTWMQVHNVPRRTLWIAVAAAALLLLLLHASGSHSKTLRNLGTKAWRFRASRGERRFRQFLAHPSESIALPLVSSIATFSLSRPASEPVNVSICAIPTHEEQFLPEWITFHRLAGVDRIHFFDNSPSTGMRRLLRPWLEEGSVVLFELTYPDGTDIGSVYQQDALRMCETFVLPNTSWASHHDVDEFLMVDAPGWTSPIPTPRRLSQDASDPSSPSIAWQYPMHLRFSDLLSKATCVPLLRVPFQNYGLRRLSADDSVIARQTVRDHLEPNYHTYGKMFIHSDGDPGRGGWMGPHSCKMPPGTVILDASGKQFKFERGSYPYDGLPLPQEGLYLYHYVQRSLEDCEHKFRVVSGTAQDWRTRDGLDGCARNFVPSDHDLDDPAARRELEALPHGKLVTERPDAWRRLFLRDTTARDSWQGRMTRAILEEWRAMSPYGAEAGWFWEHGDAASDGALERLPGIWTIKDVRKATMPDAVLSEVV